MHFWVKVSKIYFLVEKCILLKKKDVSNSFLLFYVMVTSHRDVPLLHLFRVRKLSTMNSSLHKHVLFDQLW